MGCARRFHLSTEAEIKLLGQRKGLLRKENAERFLPRSEPLETFQTSVMAFASSNRSIR
jgi:hypothetical protein